MKAAAAEVKATQPQPEAAEVQATQPQPEAAADVYRGYDDGLDPWHGQFYDLVGGGNASVNRLNEVSKR